MYFSDKLRVFIALPSFVWFLVSNRIGLSQMGSLKCCQYSKHGYEIWAVDSNAQSADVLLRPIHPCEIVPLNIYFCTKLPERSVMRYFSAITSGTYQTQLQSVPIVVTRQSINGLNWFLS